MRRGADHLAFVVVPVLLPSKTASDVAFLKQRGERSWLAGSRHV